MKASRTRRRVLLVQPGRESLWGADFAYKELLPHIGLAYVAAAVQAAGHEIRVVDGLAEGLSRAAVVERARAFDPDVVAFTANTTQVADAALIAESIRAVLPRVFTVLGGYHVSPIPVETLRAFPAFDLGVYGEGEDCLVEVLDRLEDREALAEVAGVVVRNGEEICLGPPRPDLIELDRLAPPAYDLFPLERYYGPYTLRRQRALNLTTARGCPYRCVFCQNPGGLKYRKRSIESVLDEIDVDIHRHGARLLFLTDETFTLDRRRVVEFCEGVLRRGFERHVRWFCETRVDALDRELPRLLARAGCYSLFFGLEAGSQEVLEHAQKPIAREQAIDAVRWSREAGIFTHTSFIFGHPFETRDTIAESVRLALDVNADAAGFTIMVPYPGTEVLRMAREGYGGLRLLSEDTTRYGKVVGGALELVGVPRHVLERIQILAYARFYLRPSRIGNLARVGHLSAIPLTLAHAAMRQILRWVRPLSAVGGAVATARRG